MPEFLLCSNCFHDHGLRLDAHKIGIADDSACPNCNDHNGSKLDKDTILELAHTFFVKGSITKYEYGAAPLIQFNEHQSGSSISVSDALRSDLPLFENSIGIGFFDYGPRGWMWGDIEPLLNLREPSTREKAIGKLLDLCPTVRPTKDDILYRIRKSPIDPSNPCEYDSPPLGHLGTGRFDSPSFPVLYGSPDLQVCLHECRVATEDELFVGTLKPKVDLKLLDLADIIFEDDVTEFESFDLAIHMLFLAGPHSYEIARDIAKASQLAGFDGLIYPSYFSLLRTGAMPFETVYGMSFRRIKELHDYERSKIVPNIALFGRPVEQGKMAVECINRVILRRVEYDVHFGPV